MQVPYATSDGSSSSASSPDTPSLSTSPSTCGDRTIQLSSYDGMFPSYSASQSRLDLNDSPSTFPDITESKLYCSSPVKTQLTESKLAAMQFQMSLAETISESLWSSHLSMVTGSHPWHADGSHLSLESAPVH